MRFPSLEFILQSAKTAAKRFPLSLFVAVLATGLAISLVHEKNDWVNLTRLNLMLTAALGIPLYFSVGVLSEKKILKGIQKPLGYLVATLVLILIFLNFPVRDAPENTHAPYIRYIVYFLAIHLVVAFSPYLANKDLNVFWNYNKVLFIRLVTGAFYSFVLFLGLTLALGAVHLLFKLNITPEFYLRLFLVVVGIFNTWFFLSGIPEDFSKSESESNFPRELKVFSQYLLLPLLSVYLVILYAYGAKIILTWDWPSGIVTYMIIAVSILGVFTNLLLFPFQNSENNLWMKKFFKVYYFLLVPLIVLLFVAVGIRVGQYGITVNRYIIILLGIWLSLISFYFILGFKNLKTIPISLSLFMLIGSFGPWGMFAISEKSQLNRLKTMLEGSGILREGKIQNEVIWDMDTKGNLQGEKLGNIQKIKPKDLGEVSSILKYLGDFHGFGKLKRWFDQDLSQLISQASANKEPWEKPDPATLYMETMGLRLDFGPLEGKNGLLPIVLMAKSQNQTEISGFDYLIHYTWFAAEPKEALVTELGKNRLDVNFPSDIDEKLVMIWNDKTLTLDIKPWILDLIAQRNLHSKFDFEQEALTLEKEFEGLKVRFLFSTIQLNQQEEKTRVEFVNVKLLIGTMSIANSEK
ncbi:hypothetical protein P872_17970 [Rhodonellum psychrophilum GCM71 = DSM 17998]|uniref:DUF4153 domain-containing protein n=2 Tax=Rhodonellum TaxID=336827 RepID=U5C0G9_9BACT|nr:hypothetical protein P872_17970 [Rhodonellum psychrophilum GCM71 = DSM 17998]SDY88780.1 protein of unknown function [Rhodonellum ikkaensis]